MFEDGKYMRAGIIYVRIITLDGLFLEFEADLVNTYIPLLVDLDVLDRERLIADNGDTVLQSCKHDCKMPISRVERLILSNRTLRMYSKPSSCWKSPIDTFQYLPTRKLYNILRRMKPGEAGGTILSAQKEMSTPAPF